MLSDRSGEFFAQIAEVLKAMADPMRLRLLHALQTGERCVGDLVAVVGGSQANVSKHLAVLKKAGLVRCRREGASVVYAIDEPSVFDICASVGGAIERRLGEQSRLMRDTRRRFAGSQGVQ
jgi:DNA-binding transcriptional ArsR family regulator